MTRALFVLLVCLTLMPSIVDAANSRFTFDGRVGQSVLVAQDQVRFELSLHAGDAVDATLAWANPTSRLALGVERACSAANTFCDAQAAQSNDACDAWGTGALTEPKRALRFVAPDDGVFVIIIAGIVTANPSTPFRLTLDADAATLASLAGPFSAGGLHAQRPGCVG